MAACRRFGFILSRAYNCILQQNDIICQSTNVLSGALIRYEQRRGRKRSNAPPSWFVEKESSIVPEDEMLTQDNREFVDELVHDRYARIASPLKDGPWERGIWDLRTRRTGVLAVKIGVQPQWKADGTRITTTLLQVLDNHVINYTPPEDFYKSPGWKPSWKKNYGSQVVGALSCSPHNFEKSYNNLFAKSGVPPKRKLTRFIVTDNAKIQPGTPLDVTHFRVGDVVDVQSKTIDYGFQGVIKRWKMKGGPKTHGNTKFHRRVGSIAGGKKHGIWKGKKMPGHMGDDWNTMRGLKIWRINHKHNVLYVHGQAVSGPTHCYVRIMDTCLPYRRPTLPPSMPTTFPEDIDEEFPENEYDEDVHSFDSPSLKYADSG